MMDDPNRPFATLSERQARAAMGALLYAVSIGLLPAGSEELADAWETLAVLCRSFFPSTADEAALMISWADQQRAEIRSPEK